MRVLQILVSFFLLGAQSISVNAENALDTVLMGDDAGCKVGPLEQFGRYLGDWNIEDEALSPDGTAWVQGSGARWNFTCVGGGIAIQDFWMPNPTVANPEPGVGTNLRMYEPETGDWNVAWTATRTPGFTHIRARQDTAGNIVMHYVAPKLSPARRITFFTPTETGWNWVLELSFDGEQTWKPVYKIDATLRK
tara:strand:- start:725 stop:1303 length:579 start_codon:yes stop_codon:yes gene_type:complete